jgi:hypothetical protein
MNKALERVNGVLKKISIHSGYVYLLYAEEVDRYKIGITGREPETRLSTILGQSPTESVIVRKFWSPNASNDEKSLHKRYQLYRYKFPKTGRLTEWFQFADDNKKKELFKDFRVDRMDNYSYENATPTLRQMTFDLLEVLGQRLAIKTGDRKLAERLASPEDDNDSVFYLDKEGIQNAIYQLLVDVCDQPCLQCLNFPEAVKYCVNFNDFTGNTSDDYLDCLWKLPKLYQEHCDRNKPKYDYPWWT